MGEHTHTQGKLRGGGALLLAGCCWTGSRLQLSEHTEDRSEVRCGGGAQRNG
jgi:hypothetical protein